MAAVAALPDLDLALFKDLGGLDVAQQRAVALLVMALDLADEAELLRQLGKALFLCGLGERIVHVGPLVVFALSGGEQIVGGGADALELFEPHLGVLLFVVRGLLEERSDLLIALFLCLGCEEGVLVAGLAFTSESLPQVFLCLAASQFHSIASVYNIF